MNLYHKQVFTFGNILNYIFRKGSPTKRLIIEFYLICKHGTKETFHDIKFYISNRRIPHDQLSCFDYRNLRQTKQDFFKLLPFTFFLVVPLSEIVLPAYLLFFPNSIPRRYVKYFLETRKTTFIEKKREKALEIFRENNEDFRRFKNFDCEMLIKTADILRMEYFSFTFVISQILNLIAKSPFYLCNLIFWLFKSEKRFSLTHWIFDYRIKLTFFPFGHLRKMLLYYQIQRNLRQLIGEDQKLLSLEDERINNIDYLILKSYLEDRGFKLIKQDKSFIVSEILVWKNKIGELLNEKEQKDIVPLYLNYCLQNSRIE